jgi:hypothetical protein
MNLIQINNVDCYLRFGTYSGTGRTVIQLIDAFDHRPILQASVNIPAAPCTGSHQVSIKSSVSEGIKAVLIEAGIIGPEHNPLPAGHRVATLHTILIEDLEAWNAEVDRAMEAAKVI